MLTTRLHHNTVKDGVDFGGGTHHVQNNIFYGSTRDCELVDGRHADDEREQYHRHWRLPDHRTAIRATDPQLPANPTGQGSRTRFPLSLGSPAVDAAGDCTGLTTVDQIGTSRPQWPGGQCDIGAFELPQDPPSSNPPGGRDTDSRSGRDDGRSAEASLPAAAPKKPKPVSTCLSLPEHIVVSNVTPTTQCQEVAGYVIGNKEIAAVAIYAVDVWGWVQPDTQVCFAGTSGSFKFIDTTPLPRVVYDSAPVGIDGMICTMIDRPGMVALLPGPPAPAATPMPPDQWGLGGCMVRTKFILNLRSSPGGPVIGAVPYDVTLTAMARTADWFKVDYLGTAGWVSNGYLEAKGNCG